MNNMTRNIKRTLQSFLICFCIVLNIFAPAAFAAGDEPSYLSGIKINGLDVVGFSPETTEYTVRLPYVYDLEKGVDVIKPLVAEPKALKGGTSVEIIYPDVTDGMGGDVITVISGEGNSTVEYTFNLELIGENLYFDGGFESGETSMVFKNGGVKLTNVSDAVFSGEHAMKIERPSYGLYYFNNSPKAVGGKTYLLANSVRLYDTKDTSYKSDNMVDGFNGTSKHYDADGNPKANGSSEISGKWGKYFVSIVPSSDYIIKNFYTVWDKEKTIVIDDCYAGELVISDINVNIEESAEIPTTDDDDFVITAEAKILNQFSNGAGLENEIYEISVPDGVKGVYTDGDDIVITKNAISGEVPVTFTVVPSFNGAVQELVQKTIYINLMPKEGAETLPEARNVEIIGTVSDGNILKAKYDYYHIYGDKEGTTQIKWLYCDKADGEYTEIPETLNKTEYKVDKNYINGFIKIEVTPASEIETGKPACSEPVSAPVAPEALDVTISGTRAVGQTLKGDYVYYDRNGDAEGESVLQWKRIEADGSYTAIGTKNSKEYVITEDDIDREIVFCVTPVSLTEPKEGTEAESEPVIGATAPCAEDLSIDDNNGLLTLDYIYYHPNGIKEGKTKCLWYFDGNEVAEGFTYRPGKSGTVKAVVVPVAQLAPYDGEETSVEIRFKKKSSGVSVSGGGGGGGFSYVPVPQKPEVTEPAEQEPEVDPNAHWAEASAKFAIEKGIMENPKEDDFCYDQKVTRGEFIYYIVKALGLKADKYNYDFNDVLATDRFAKELSVAVENGIISSNDNYYPLRNVSRQEVCKILVTGMNLTLNEEGTKRLSQFSDVQSVGEWATEYVDVTLSNGVLVGVSDSVFNPLGDITRAETAVLVKRIVEFITTGKVGA